MFSSWEVKEIPAPEPGPNQVLIKIHASGLCFTDVHQTRGEIPGTFPRTLGHEPTGEIVGVGTGVRTRRTDAHNLRRCSGLSAAYAWVRERLGQQRAHQLRERGHLVLSARVGLK